jgi:APA family basic amino acid/polyamine antiporter
VVVAVLGSLAAYTMSAPRVYFAMARDRLFLPAAARLNPRTGAPVRAIVMQAALACALVLLGTFDEIISYFMFAVVLFVTLTVAGLFVLRRKGGEAEYMTPLYPLTPVVYLVLSAGLLFLLALGSPRQAFSGVAVVALGLPVYYLLFRRPGGARRV